MKPTRALLYKLYFPLRLVACGAQDQTVLQHTRPQAEQYVSPPWHTMFAPRDTLNTSYVSQRYNTMYSFQYAIRVAVPKYGVRHRTLKYLIRVAAITYAVRQRTFRYVMPIAAPKYGPSNTPYVSCSSQKIPCTPQDQVRNIRGAAPHYGDIKFLNPQHSIIMWVVLEYLSNAIFKWHRCECYLITVKRSSIW